MISTKSRLTFGLFLIQLGCIATFGASGCGQLTEALQKDFPNGSGTTSTITTQTTVSFKTTIGPYIAASCATSACHGGSQTPILTNGYSALMSYGFSNISSALNGDMSTHSTPTFTGEYSTWVSQGGQNN